VRSCSYFHIIGLAVATVGCLALYLEVVVENGRTSGCGCLMRVPFHVDLEIVQ